MIKHFQFFTLVLSEHEGLEDQQLCSGHDTIEMAKACALRFRSELEKRCRVLVEECGEAKIKMIIVRADFTELEEIKLSI